MFQYKRSSEARILIVSNRSQFSLAAAALVLAACGGQAPKGAIDSGIVRAIPPDVQVLAGVDFDRLGTLAEPMRARLGAPTETRTLLGAESFSGILLIARGSFPQAPANATLIAPGVAAIGTADAVAAAAARYRSGGGAASDLIARGQKLAGRAPLWAEIAGGVTLPLSGNLANINRLLRSTEYTEVTVQPGDKYSISITGVCRSAGEAENLERTLRGFLALAKAAKGNQELVSGVEIHMKDRSVEANLSMDRAAVEALLR